MPETRTRRGLSSRCLRSVALLCLAASVVRPAVSQADSTACAALISWVDRVAGGSDFEPGMLIPPADTPRGPDGFTGRVVGGRLDGDLMGIELVVTAGDDADAERATWLSWVEACATRDRRAWSQIERDVEAARRVPAAKSSGVFPSEAYIREDPEPAGMRLEADSVVLQVVTGPTALAARAAEAGYDGPPVLLLVRILRGGDQ